MQSMWTMHRKRPLPSSAATAPSRPPYRSLNIAQELRLRFEKTHTSVIALASYTYSRDGQTTHSYLAFATSATNLR
ncbi:hypothetical protein BD414DRAFT_189798 [Trametes punicea]|nr:hypothetical protein BD414DRAFT_189798 [Trametes punicea]